MSEWREALLQLQSDVSARPLKQDMDAMSLLMDKQMKMLSRRLSRLSRQLEPDAPRTGRTSDDASAGAFSDEAAVMKKQIIADFSCLSCDKKLLFARKEYVANPLCPVSSCCYSLNIQRHTRLT